MLALAADAAAARQQAELHVLAEGRLGQLDARGRGRPRPPAPRSCPSRVRALDGVELAVGQKPRALARPLLVAIRPRTMLRMYSILKNLLKRKLAHAENFDTERARRRRSRLARDALARRLRRCVARLALGRRSSAAALLVAAGGRTASTTTRMKVRGFEPPLGWEPQPVGSYARLLGAWETKDGGRHDAGRAEGQATGTTARSLADESRPALRAAGLPRPQAAPAPPPSDDSDRVDARRRRRRRPSLRAPALRRRRRHRLRRDHGRPASRARRR